jgi:hypothetical protein
MIQLVANPRFVKTDSFFQRILEKVKLSSLDKWGKKGVDALSSATPVDTGKTASSWSYKIERNQNGVKLVWLNSNVNDGVNIALIIQYGHVSRNGVYVEGRDYINPTLVPIFNEIEEDAWKEVKNA